MSILMLKTKNNPWIPSGDSFPSTGFFQLIKSILKLNLIILDYILGYNLRTKIFLDRRFTGALV